MSSGFVTETELEEKRKQRQEEWDRVRKPDDPEQAPDEPHDTRSLFERLEEQRTKKQMEWDEEHKFKNQFRGLNDDEVDFLDKVDDIRAEVEVQRMREEQKELEDYQQKQLAIREQELQERLRNEIRGPDLKRSTSKTGLSGNSGKTSSKSQQQKLLLGAVKRKSNDVNQDQGQKRTKSESSDTTDKTDQPAAKEANSVQKGSDKASGGQTGSSKPVVGSGGGLAGLLGDYGSDSDSE